MPEIRAAVRSVEAHSSPDQDASAGTAVWDGEVVGKDSCPPGEPLAERAFLYSCSRADLLQWRASAAARVTEGVRDAFSEAEGGGPTQKELLRELDWLLEDAIGRAALDELKSSRPLASSTVSCASASSTDPQPLLAAVPARASLAELESLWCRRIGDREPLQYLVGAAHWRDIVLAVRPGVLIPRPETEVLPDLALEALEARPELAFKPWADLGTGSGALAAALAQVLLKFRRRFKGEGCRAGGVGIGQGATSDARDAISVERFATGPPAEAVGTGHVCNDAEGNGDVLVWAVDCSDVAVATASENMKRLQLQVRQETELRVIHVRDVACMNKKHLYSADVPTSCCVAVSMRSHWRLTGSCLCVAQDHVRVVKGSWFEPLAQHALQGSLGGVLSNPPYIPSSRMPTLQVG